MKEFALDQYRKFFPEEEIPSLYSYQLAAIRKITQGKNTLSIVPTGGGKSLIYQLSALFFDGLTIVISPLVALMREQEEYLRNKQINAQSISSELTFQEQRHYLAIFKNDSPKILYVSPERLQNEFFKKAIVNSNLKVSLIAIDEAHCISEWGIDFRPEYSQIPEFIDFLKEHGQRPVTYALTATLSKKPRADIQTEFGISTENVIVDSNVIRDNLHIEFHQVKSEGEKIEKVYSFLQETNCSKVLIYFYSKKICENISVQLSSKGIPSSFYHADLDTDRKANVYRQFHTGGIRVLCSTTAFGMGMNIPDIDSIIHYHIPSTIEEYYQHIGRGARKKEVCPQAFCYLLWSEENFKVKRRRLREGALTEEDVLEAWERFDLYNKQEISTIDYNDYKNSNINLPLMKLMFEKNGLVETIGEIHGTPDTIEFKGDPPLFWKKLQDSASPMDSYKLACKRLGIDIREVIDFLYTKELDGEVLKIPALNKKIVLRCKETAPPSQTINNIVKESSDVVGYQLEKVEDLRELMNYSSQMDIKKYIARCLDVDYKG